MVGALETSEFKRQSLTMAQFWRQGMAETRYEEVFGMNHFTVLDALSDPASPMVARIAELAQRVKAWPVQKPAE